jgi:hypothetical protein
MNEQELMEQAASLAPVYCDGFSCYRKLNGVLRCIGWTIDGGAHLSLIVSLAGADAANRAARFALDAESPKTIESWNGARLAH